MISAGLLSNFNVLVSAREGLSRFPYYLAKEPPVFFLLRNPGDWCSEECTLGSGDSVQTPLRAEETALQRGSDRPHMSNWAGGKPGLASNLPRCNVADYRVRKQQCLSWRFPRRMNCNSFTGQESNNHHNILNVNEVSSPKPQAPSSEMPLT